MRCTQTFISRTRAPYETGGAERGSTAILLVLGTATVMLLVGLSLVTQMVQEIKMSRAEQEIAVIQATVMAAVKGAVAQAEADDVWPSTGITTQNCTPEGSTYPACTIYLLPRRSVNDEPQIPFRIVVRPSAQSRDGETYGWLVWDDDNQLFRLYFYHRWCPDGGTQACSPGG